MNDNRNTILAIILSGLVLIAWQYFYNMPQMERQRAAQQVQTELQKAQQQQAQNPNASSAPTTPANGPAGAPTTPTTAPIVPRETEISSTPRVKIETPRLTGSIALKGGRIDDLSLIKFRETVDPASPPIVLFAPSNTANPYYVEFGWVPTAGSTVRLPISIRPGSRKAPTTSPRTARWC